MGDAKETMNRFVHRILKSSTASSIAGGQGKTSTHHHAAPAVHQLVNQELQHAKLLYFGEFHSESRIISFQTELIKEWEKCLASSSSSVVKGTNPPRLHLIMEHFSVDMQPILDRYVGTATTDAQQQEDNDEAFDRLVKSYKNDFGTEGHDLHPYRNLLQFCRQTNTKRQTHNYPEGNEEAEHCEIHIHGGFIPRNHAARLNKECPDDESKQFFFEEMSTQRGYLPKKGDAMHTALFEDCSSSSSFELRGSLEHRYLIQSLMKGTDLYSPPPSEEVVGHSDAEGGGDEATADEESPMSRLYQAQLLKDHAMGFRIASLMLDHYDESDVERSLSSDRYIVIAGFGHLKHYLGVPDCVNGYLRQEALLHPDERRRAAAMDLLLAISRRPPLSSTGLMSVHKHKFGGNGSALIGCQMMYEAYLEDTYAPMIDASKQSSEDEDDDDDDDAEHVKKKLLKDLYLQHPKLLDEYIMKSQEISGPLLHFANGIAGFEQPCADFLFVYDEDDDNIIGEADLDRTNESKCPFQDQPNSGNRDAKYETAEAYERVGKTAGRKGNVAKARAIMSQIGYTKEDIAYIGDDDIYNFQGVANPHNVAKIQPGEAVLDIGSGLGIDSFLAMRDCGADKYQQSSDGTTLGPFVVGVDLAESEVRHTTKRASERGYSVPQRIQFICGDVERLDEAFSVKNLPMGKFDVCISNGAFCLVPDKSKAFGNVFKALKPGGRMAISTTTIVSDHLDPSFEWPICMKMFASLDTIQPMCESLGFQNVRIIDAESPMEGMDIPVEDEGPGGDDGRQRFMIHGRYADQFSFLENLDMDELCRVVTVYGDKPWRSN